MERQTIMNWIEKKEEEEEEKEGKLINNRKGGCKKDRHRQLKDGVLHKGNVAFSILVGSAFLLSLLNYFFHLIKNITTSNNYFISYFSSLFFLSNL